MVFKGTYLEEWERVRTNQCDIYIQDWNDPEPRVPPLLFCSDSAFRLTATLSVSVVSL